MATPDLERDHAQQGDEKMATDGDKMAAATIAAALLQPFESSGEVGDTGRIQTRAIKRAVNLYQEILAALQDPPIS
jgi:hypothetical protein